MAYMGNGLNLHIAFLCAICFAAGAAFGAGVMEISHHHGDETCVEECGSDSCSCCCDCDPCDCDPCLCGKEPDQ